MNKFLRWYNNNKKIFWIRLLIIIGIYAIIIFLNSLSAKKVSTNQVNNVKEDYTQKTVIKNDKSIIDSEVKQEDFQRVSQLIDKFITLCNNDNYEKAYELLSKDCKEKLFPNVEMFKENYCKNIFMSGSKMYNMQNWSGQTYKIEYRDNIMATGGERTDQYIQDYITIINENNTNKLNVNGYIKKYSLGKSTQIENVNIIVVEKNTFMNYETYTINIENNSKNSFLLDSLEITDTIYLEDNHNVKYYAYVNELTPEMLEVKPKTSKNIEIRFTNAYVTNRKISSLIFNKVVLNKQVPYYTNNLRIEL